MRAASTPARSPISRIVVPSKPCWPKRVWAAWSRASLLAAASRGRPPRALLELSAVASLMLTVDRTPVLWLPVHRRWTRRSPSRKHEAGRRGGHAQGGSDDQGHLETGHVWQGVT